MISPRSPFLNSAGYLNNNIKLNKCFFFLVWFEGGDIAENIFMCDSKQTYMYNWPYQESDEYLKRSS